MRKIDGKEIVATDVGPVEIDIVGADLKAFNRKADEWLAARGHAVGNWKSREKRKLAHRSAMAAVNKKEQKQ